MSTTRIYFYRLRTDNKMYTNNMVSGIFGDFNQSCCGEDIASLWMPQDEVFALENNAIFAAEGK